MGATTTRKTSNNGNSAPAEPSLSKRRETLIAAYHEQAEANRAATEKGDKKAAGSAQAHMSNLSKKIRDTETDLEAEGIEFEPFQKPRASRSGSSRPAITEPQLKADLAKLGKVNKATQKLTVKKNTDQRIETLLKKAKQLSYKVADPRK